MPLPLFETPKDFEYFLKHPNTVEIIELIKQKTVKKNTIGQKQYNDGILPEFFAEADLGFCKISIDRKGTPEYRLKWENGAREKQSEDFDDFLKLVCFIAAKWY